MRDKKEHKSLTIAELRSFHGFENYTDEQAKEAIETLEKLSVLFYKLHMRARETEKDFKTSGSRKKQASECIVRNIENGTNGEQPIAA